MSIKKRLASAAFQLTLSNSVLRLLAVVTMPLLTRLLTPEAYGSAAMAGTLISLISVVALSGIDMSYARGYFAKENPTGRAVEAFAWRYALSMGLLSGTAAVFAWWFMLADTFHLPKYLAILIGSGVFFSIANTMAQTRARIKNQYRRMSVALVLSGVGAAVVSIGVAIWWRQDEFPLILSSVVGVIIPVLILGIPATKVLFFSSGLAKYEQRAVLKIGIAGIVTAPMYWIMTSLDRWFLGYYETSATVGIYAIGYSVATVGMIINNALASVWLPEASKAFEQHQENARIELGHMVERLVAVLGLVWLVIAAVGGDVIRLLAAGKFHGATDVVPFIAGAVFFYGVSNLMNAGLLLKHKLSIAMWWWLVSAIVCIALNFFLVPAYGNLGAAVTQTLSFAFCACGMFFSTQRVFPLTISVKKLILVIFLIIPSGILMSSSWSALPLLSILLKIPVTLAIAWLVVRYMVPELLKFIIQWLLTNELENHNTDLHALHTQEEPKVIMYCSRFRPEIGGAERQAEKLAIALVAAGCKVTILTPRIDKISLTIEEIHGVRIERFHMIDLSTIIPLRYIAIINIPLMWGQIFKAARIRLREADILHCHLGSMQTVGAAMAAHLAGKPMLCKAAVADNRSDLGEVEKAGFAGPMVAWILRKLMPIWIATTEAVGDALIRAGVKPEAIVRIPNGVEVTMLSKRAGTTTAVKRFLYLGRISVNADRDIPTLIHAFNKLILKYADIEMAIVGGGDLFDATKKMVAESPAQKNIYLPGFDNPEKWLAWADCFILPSRREGLSNALLEAMAVGLPCIANDILPNREVLADGNAGVLVPVEDESALLEIMEKMASDAAYANSMGKAALQRVQSQYTMTSIARRYIELYKTLIMKEADLRLKEVRSI